MRPFIVHSLDHARAALDAAASLGLPVAIQSAAGAGAYAGVAWFERLVATAHAETPAVELTAVLDCGDAPGAVLEAVRWLKEPGRYKLRLCFTGDAATAARLAEIAAAAGLDLVRESPPGLDLRAVAEAPAACRTWLADTTARAS
jgi:hypothetical protein